MAWKTLPQLFLPKAEQLAFFSEQLLVLMISCKMQNPTSGSPLFFTPALFIEQLLAMPTLHYTVVHDTILQHTALQYGVYRLRLWLQTLATTAAQPEQPVKTPRAEDPAVTPHTSLEGLLRASPHGLTAGTAGASGLCSGSGFSSSAQSRRDPG